MNFTIIDNYNITKIGINRHLDVKQHLIDLHPMKRLGQPDEIAKGFIFLSCEESSFISGTSLEIDGGFLAE